MTGHNYFKKHFYLIGVADNPDSNLCSAEKEITADHLNTCPAPQDIRSANTGANTFGDATNVYLAARIRMEESDELAKGKKVHKKITT